MSNYVEDKEYLGDGVYAEYDGLGIVLKANEPTTDTIYLEFMTMEMLIRFYEKVKKKKRKNI